MSMPLRLPLHIPVAVLFSFLILAVGATISVYHFGETRLLIEAANATLFHDRAEDVRKTLSNANRAVRGSFILLAASPLADASTRAQRFQFLPELTGLLDADPLIDSVMVGYGDGALFLVQRARSGAMGVWSVIDMDSTDDHVDADSGLEYFFDKDLRLIRASAWTGARIEPRLSDWYRLAAASDRIEVTKAYDFQHGQGRGITFARRNGSSVFGVNVSFARIGNLLAEQVLTPSTRISLVAQDDSTIAAPGMSSTTPRDPAADGRAWKVSIAPMPGFVDETWKLVVATPEDELFAEAYRLRQRSILFTVLAVILSFPLAWALSRLLTRPLHRLAENAREVSALQFEPQADARSVILEVDQLAGAMSMMSGAIARFLEMGRDLGSARDVASVLQQVEAGAREVAHTPWSAVRVDGEWGEGMLAAHWLDTAGVELSAVARAAEDLSAFVMQADGPLSLRLPASDGGMLQVLGIPLRTPEGEALGTLVLADRPSARCGLARAEVIGFLAALAGTAAVALENQRLLKGRKALLKGVVRMVGEAIDAKSPHTGRHCRRVPELALRLARAAHEAEAAPFTAYRLDASGWEALEIASWLHDCGKLTTPEYVIDKATKLETLYNRIHEIRTRFEVLKRDVEIVYWKGLAQGGDEAQLRAARDELWRTLDEDFAFVAACNRGSEDMPAESQLRLEGIARKRWLRTLDEGLGLSNAELARRGGVPAKPLPADEPLLRDDPADVIPPPPSDHLAEGNPWGFSMRAPANLYNGGELYNLRIRHGTLTEEERFKVKEHIIESIVMLSRLPFPSDLAAVPEMAGGHHETMDGRGYPRGLCGSDMSMTARIMAIADIFEALTASDRPYKDALTVTDTLEIMRDMSRRMVIDPDLFVLFVTKELWRDEAASVATPAIV
jgi:HD-GYP domain-containing protein (c-di-GMP phosphodiesterase class II)